MKSNDTPFKNRRILIVDDNPAIHEDFRKILAPTPSEAEADLHAAEVSLFGVGELPEVREAYVLTYASQGQEALDLVREAEREQAPFAMAFLDIRMPPGWDGVETMAKIWNEFPDLQVVICTAYSDYSWEQIARMVGDSDKLLVLKKPFDSLEVLQMAQTLTRKWELTQMANSRANQLEALVQLRTAELSCVQAKLERECEEHRIANVSLRASEERFSKAFNGSPLAMAIQRAGAFEFLDANRSFLKLLECERDHIMIGCPSFWADPEMAPLVDQRMRAERPLRNHATTLKTAKGSTRHVLVSIEPLMLGATPFWLLILQDISDRVRLENDLRHAQKMEAIGSLAGGIAHDFNNALVPILGYSDTLLHQMSEDAPERRDIEEIKRAALSAAALTRQLLAFSRRQTIAKGEVDVNGMIRSMEPMLRRLLGETVELSCGVDEARWLVRGDQNQLEQVLMNLCINARQAMATGGELEVSTLLRDINSPGFIVPVAAQGHGSFIRLTVRDTGHGMTPEILARVFDPFYTTKGEAGNGLGLSVAHGIIAEHGGWFDLKSQEGVGTEVSIYLPLLAVMLPDPAAARAQVLPDLALGEGQGVLLIEDDESVISFLKLALSEHGYRVTTAQTGAEGRDAFRIHREMIDLVLCDVVLPDEDGVSLVRSLMEMQPGLKVIVSSGYNDSEPVVAVTDHPNVQFLHKPYALGTLLDVVKALLRSEAGTTCLFGSGMRSTMTK